MLPTAHPPHVTSKTLILTLVVVPVVATRLLRCSLLYRSRAGMPPRPRLRLSCLSASTNDSIGCF